MSNHRDAAGWPIEPTKEELKAEITTLKEGNRSKAVAMGGFAGALILSLAFNMQMASETVRLNQGKETQSMEPVELTSAFVDAANPVFEKNETGATIIVEENGEEVARFGLGTESLSFGAPSNK